ncbi:hypothetical protein [Duganella callida]|uniref:Uncharacterized protein n=1 Tax=Duganella callida TaxID=2561932 RepID=A0A4Y9SUB0_9BURK|nr:hypothetical protein [Duganella callida]TFW29067.1 hypothetical protein E4L98_04800 [Duganella callida]
MSETKSISEAVTTYSKDTPIGRPDLDGRAAVFVPSGAFDPGANAAIRLGSGIVGFGNPDGTLTVYFEGNRFDESSLHKWENKARKAYDRMVACAPTVSKAKINANLLEQIGTIDGMGIHLKQPERLQQWLAQANALDTAPAGPVTLWKTK